MSKQLFHSPPLAPKDFGRKCLRNAYLCLFVTLLFATTALRAYGAELVGYWNFDEGIGSVATDLSGYNNTGMLTNGPLWTAGKSNGGLSFDGSDDYVEINHSASLNITRELTVSAWVYNQAEYEPLLPDSEYHIIATKGWAPDTGGSWTLGWDKKTNDVFFCVRKRNNSDFSCTSFDFGSLAPNWHLITAVFNNNGRIRLYVDGALAAGPVNVGTAMNANTEPVLLGYLPSSTPSQILTWHGYIDDVRIYNAALSDVAIASLYQDDSVIIQQRNFDFTIASSGNVATSQGSAVSTNINTVLTSGTPKFASFSVSGLPANVTSSFSSSSCSPSCSTILTLQTNSSAPVGTYTLKVTGKAGGVTKTTSFNLSINQATIATVATPTITPDSGIFPDSVSVSLQDATSGASIYYTTDGSTPTQSSSPYTGALLLTKSTVMKAKAFRSGYAPSSTASASLTVTQSFDFSLSNSGAISVNAGSSGSNTITPILTSGTSQSVAFSVSGLPSGATGSFSTASCGPTCSTVLTVNTSGSTPAGNFPLTVTSTGGGVTRTTAFTLSVSASVALVVATPTITPNGGTYTGSVPVTLQTSTAGASIYYTTNGSTPSQSSTPYTGAMTLTNSAVVKAAAFKSGYNPSAQASASFTVNQPQPFDFSLSNSGAISVNAGSYGSNTITPTLTSGTSQSVAFSVSGLPSGAAGSFSSASCSPTCSTVLIINTSGSTPAGNFPITVTSTGGGVTRTTNFILSVTVSAALVVATPTITPNGGSFSDSVSVSIGSATSGASVYYTTDGSSPTQSSTVYSGPMTLTSSTVFKAKAFKSGYNPSVEASASFAIAASTGNVYHVGKNGSDSYSCTQALSSSTPKLTINAALACIGTTAGAGSGQIVEVGTGTYTEAINNNLPKGSSWSAPFTLRANPGDTVTMRATDEHNVYLSDGGAKYAIIQGFVLDGTNLSNSQIFILNPTTHIRFQGLDIINTMTQNGIFIDDEANNIEVIGSKIHGGTFSVGAECCGYPIYIEGSNNLISGNEVYNAPGFGIHLYSGAPNKPNNNVVTRNLVHDVGSHSASEAAIIVTSGSGNLVSNNIIYNSSAHGIQIAMGATNSKIYNNTVYGSAQTGILNWYANVTGTVIKNNISYNNAGGGIIDQTGNGTQISNNLLSDPRFVNPMSADFNIQSGSPAINTGVNLSSEGISMDFNGTLRAQGCCYDIGAFEYK